MWKVILLCIVVFLLILLVVRVLWLAGLDVKLNNQRLRRFHEKWKGLEAAKERYIPNKKECANLFLVLFGFRILVYFVSIMIICMNMGEGAVFNWDVFLNEWTRWDAAHYIKIAELGYGGAIEDGKHLFLVFFPLYPYLMRILNILIGNMRLTGLLISTLAFCGGGVYLYKLVTYDYGKKVAKNAVILIAVFPFAFFFGGIMTESLFFLLTVAGLYYIRTHRWHLAVVFGILAAMTRMHGILLLVPGIVELFMVEKPVLLIAEKKFKLFIRSFCFKVLGMLGMSLGTLFYLFENYRTTGNPFEFMIHQKNHWNQGFTLFTETIAYHIKYVMNQDYDISLRLCLWITALTLFVISFVLFVYGMVKIRSTYSCYFIIYFLINYSVTWLLSAGRYMSCAIPMFIVLGILANKNKVVKYALVVGSAMLFVVYLTGFLYGKHIM